MDKANGLYIAESIKHFSTKSEIHEQNVEPFLWNKSNYRNTENNSNIPELQWRTQLLELVSWELQLH